MWRMGRNFLSTAFRNYGPGFIIGCGPSPSRICREKPSNDAVRWGSPHPTGPVSAQLPFPDGDCPFMAFQTEYATELRKFCAKDIAGATRIIKWTIGKILT